MYNKYIKCFTTQIYVMWLWHIIIYLLAI